MRGSKTMRKRLLAIGLVASFALLGCQTTYYHNGGSSTAVGADQFHHIVAFALVEISDPVDPKAQCGGNWSTEKTELHFVAGFVRAMLAPFYTPWGTAVGCR